MRASGRQCCGDFLLVVRARLGHRADRIYVFKCWHGPLTGLRDQVAIFLIDFNLAVFMVILFAVINDTF